MLHVPQDEVGGEGAKTGSNVGLGEIQLSRVTQTSASEPGNVLNELEEAKEHFGALMPSAPSRKQEGRRAKPFHSDWPHLSYSERGAQISQTHPSQALTSPSHPLQLFALSLQLASVSPRLTSSRSISSGLPKGLRNCPPRDFLRGTTTM